MLNLLIRLSLRHRLLVCALAALLASYGGFLLARLPVDVLPDLNRSVVTVFTEAPGMAPEDVENIVSRPIETAMAGAVGVQGVRSSSSAGLSIVIVEFDFATNVRVARQTVTERLQPATESLPPGVRPVLGPISSIMGEIMLIGVTSDNPATTQTDLRTFADKIIRPRLLATPGVSQITTIGGDLAQYQILVDPARLKQHSLSLHDIADAATGSNASSSGGILNGPFTETIVRNFARAASLDDLRGTPIPRRDWEPPLPPGVPALTLGDLADIRLGPPPAKRGSAGVNALPAVILSVQKQPGADTLALTKLLDQRVAELRGIAPAGVTIHNDLFRQADFIARAVHNVEEALRDGALLVSVILILFLLNLRATLVTLTAIPLSFLITAIIFHIFGVGINTMTLGGLAVAIGELVDDATVDIENIIRRLRENAAAAAPLPTLEVVFRASSEVRGSIVIATIVVILVFLPLFALSGIEGRIFAPLGLAYITSIGASLLVSLTLTPALASLLLGGVKKTTAPEKASALPPLVRAVRAIESALLAIAFPRAYPILALVACVFAAAAATTPWLGREFLPPFNEGSLTINLVSAPGTSLQESDRIGAAAERILLAIPEVSATGRRTGRAELDDHAEGVHSTDIEANFRDSPANRPRAAVLADVRERLAALPGVAVNIGQPISHRLDHLLSGVRAQIAVKIFGPDLPILRQKAADVRDIMASVPGLTDIFIEKQATVPQLHIRLNRDKCRALGVTPGEAAEYIELALEGRVVSQILDGNLVRDVVLRLRDDARDDPDAIRQIPIDTPGDRLVPLEQIADIEEAKGPNLINREDGGRRIYISANVAGRDLAAAVAELQAGVAQRLALPPGYTVTFGGQFETQASATRLIGLLSILSLAGMFIALRAHFGATALALQVLVNIPLAFIGSVAAVWLMGGVLSVATLVGFVTLTGIASRNGIMMLSHYLHLMEHEGESFTKAMIVRGTQERVVPVLITALTAGLALVPLVLAAGEPGREILHPVATVILGGIVTSTLLDFVVTPLVFWKFAWPSVRRLLPGVTRE